MPPKLYNPSHSLNSWPNHMPHSQQDPADWLVQQGYPSDCGQAADNPPPCSFCQGLTQAQLSDLDQDQVWDLAQQAGFDLLELKSHHGAHQGLPRDPYAVSWEHFLRFARLIQDLTLSQTGKTQ